MGSENGDGKLVHMSSSPQMVGDVDVTFWTRIGWEDVSD